MRRLLLHIACIVLFTEASAQKPLGPLAQTIPTGAGLIDINDREWKYSVSETGADWESHDNVTGTLFFAEDFNTGYILLDGNRLAKDVSIRFNVYTGQVYFKKDSQVMVLDAAVPIAEFGYWNNSLGQAIVFRCGYPDIAGNTAKTFYEVLQYGKLSLLEKHTKRIVEKRDIHGVPEKIITDAEAWFVYDAATNKIVEIKHNKNSLLEALPAYSNTIQSIIQEKNLKLKSEADWVTLFKQLNGKS